MPEIEIDRPDTYSALDVDDMYRRVNELPEQMAEAWGLSQEIDLPDELRGVRNIVVTGMGGSAIGGSLLEAYGTPDVPVPLSVWRGYGLPGSVNAETLVIAVSYSGNTEETLSALDEARRRGARILVVTTGGKVRQRAEEWSLPMLTFAYEAQPRATLGYLFTPLVGIMSRLGFLPNVEGEMREAIEQVAANREQWRREVPEERNEAKQLARSVAGTVTVVYGAEFLAAVARRWKTQFNENAKQWAFYEEFPELNHNAIVGYEYPRDAASRTSVVVLTSDLLSDRIATRMRVTGEVMDRFGVSHRTVSGRGTGRLAQMYTLIELGDFVTYYAALLNGADPTEIRPIDFLKRALAKG